jgi:hypothetical protein
LIAGQLDDWSQWELFIVDAIRKDKERMGRLNKLLENVSGFAAFFPLLMCLMMSIQRPSLTSQEIAEQVQLTVDVYDRSTSTVLHQTTCKSQVVPSPLIVFTIMRGLVYMEGSTRLGAVRWTIAGTFEESLRKRVRQSGEFWLLSDAVCKLHDSISQLAGSSKRLSLRLIV